MRLAPIFLLVIVAVISAEAQSPNVGRIALIDSSEFGNERTGIKRVIQAQGAALGGFIPYKRQLPSAEEFARRKAQYERRLKIVMEPVEADIAKALDLFAKARGVVVLFDLAKHPDVILVANPELDITREFIDYFNRLDLTIQRTPTRDD